MAPAEGPPPVAGTALTPTGRAGPVPDGAPVRAGGLVVGALSRAGSWLDGAAGGLDVPLVPFAVDVGIGVANVAAAAATTVLGVSWRLAAPLAQLVARPPLVPTAYQPSTVVSALAERGRRYRVSSERQADRVTAELVARIVSAVLDRIDLTELVLQRVDLDRVVASVDIQAVIRRLDLTQVVVDDVDLDAIVAGVDIEAIVDRLDLDAIVAGVDLEAIVDRVDVDAIAARLDVQAVIDRVDLVGLATYVIGMIDLPEIIRESTGSVGSDAMRGVRMQTIGADQAVQRAVDRIRLWRRTPPTGTPRDPLREGVEPTAHPGAEDDGRPT